MSNDQMRKEFEEWLAKKYGKHMVSKWDESSQDYNQLACTIAFEAWKESRQSLVVELPEMPKAQRNDEEATFSAGGCDMLRKCRKAIEAVGLGAPQ